MGGLTRTLEPFHTRSRPRDRVPIGIRHGHDGVVEGGLNVNEAAGEYSSSFARRTGSLL